ncbi:MAG: trigger factor [Bacteroidaceae bacterium]|nr:trigger factor [Bacteroidaceae bacterium]
MKVTFEKPTAQRGVVTVSIEQADYAPQVKKALKDYQKKAQLPGFRPGNVPMGLIQKRVGPAIKAEEVDKAVTKALFDYIRENKVAVLGQPLGDDSQEQQNIEGQDNFEFRFLVALEPEFDATLTQKDKIPYYNITVDDARVDEQVKGFQQRGSRPAEASEYEDGDVLRGNISELDETGAPKEGGVYAEGSSLMPKYFKADDQKAYFEGAKKGDAIIFNPTKANDGNEAELAAILKLPKEEVKEHTGDFLFTITDISRMKPAEVDQELFDQVYGKDAVKSEEEFRARIKEELTQQFAADSDFRFLIDVREYLTKRVGKLEFDEELLRRIVKQGEQDGDKEMSDEDFQKSVEELQWHLTRQQLIEKQGLKLEADELQQTAVQAARFQFAQYGMSNIPDEYLLDYAKRMLDNEEQRQSLVRRALDTKLSLALKNVVTLDQKQVSLDDFNKLFEKA